ncbi:hypothetical protein [Streptomyces sp. RKAG293]|uniref:hypothetical protein n=1 Tax=Streptomyces sp. RKAG293 TaxID=2893403 RepID=UPI0020344731|nr:hypothetical protein [Streptomyces sp. RKAG293]MCM2416947.1 hypothetical protein [Streptomyces sp. RKAG293]
MSGRKRISVDEAEWYRVQRKAQQLKEVLSTLPGLVEDIRSQTRADLDRTFARVSERQQRHEAAMGELSQQTRRLEADTTRRLQEQAKDLHRELAATAGRLREETRQALAEQQAQVRQALAAERAERRAETARLAADIDIMKEDRARAEETVRAWLADANVMAGLIAEAGLHERYAPQELERLQARLATAGQNLAQGRFDAALALAQETYHSLSELRVDTEQRELERCSAQTAAVESLVRVERLIEGNLERPVLGADGTAMEGFTLDVEFWSRDELDGLRQETADGLSQARDDGTDVEALHGLREREAPRLERTLGDTVAQAGMRHLASQIRVNLADAVAQTLGELAFYDFVDGEYQDADPRGAYYAKLQHDNGNEIVLDISQAARDSGECVVRVLSYDHDVTSEAELRGRAEAIQEALKGEGHNASRPVSEPGAPDPELLDIERHRAEAERRTRATEQNQTLRKGQSRPGAGGV